MMNLLCVNDFAVLVLFSRAYVILMIRASYPVCFAAMTVAARKVYEYFLYTPCCALRARQRIGGGRGSSFHCGCLLFRWFVVRWISVSVSLVHGTVFSVSLRTHVQGCFALFTVTVFFREPPSWFCCHLVSSPAGTYPAR